ncbi:MAG: metallophosphoesterase [Bacteroidales bacterium]|nr:metallophosphoesterase [Bacteroidales bacterium]
MRRLFSYILTFIVLVSCAEKPYVIVQIADAQLGFTAADKSQKEGTEYVNDLTYEIDCLTKAVSIVNEIKPDAVVFTGDQVNRCNDSEQWDAFARVISEIDPAIKVFHIPGNHDVIISDGDVDTTPFTDRYGEDRFIHVDRGVRLAGINSNLIKYNDPREAEQIGWMKDVLTKDTPEEVSIIFSHHPFFLKNIDEEDGYFQIQKDKRQEYFNICTELDVNALYAGHLHNDSEGSYEGIPVSTTTSVAFQIGPAQPSIRVITVSDGEVSDVLITVI